MTKQLGLGAALLSATIAVAAPASAQSDYRTDLQLGTAQPGGSYFALGAEYASIFEADIPGTKVASVETGGSVDNLIRIGKGEIQLGLAQATTAYAVFEGKGKFEGAKVDNVRLLGCLEPYALHIITREGSGITSLKDATGRRVAIGSPGSANQLASLAVLAANGLAEGSYTALAEGSNDARDKLQDGNVDVVIDMQTIPYAGLLQVQASIGDAKLLPIEPDAMSKLLSETKFAEFAIPGAAYDFTSEDVPTISDWSCLFASETQVSPELAYDITKSVYESNGKLTLKSKDNISINNALLAKGPLPLHSGAQKYYDEKGVSK
ncbi:TAXI family TRAP transporter solute-binding subunit [Limibacillus halophilus]|uniref:TRAP transporter solute receptor, TAXI family n=1 Tax=Limibacillus halophilus TaxID=1579333 RepID=A0A839SRX1_9PROT|nr:TAXI family TRAP transporter solute-binding subunit [Limibacillus halophilus]MBB3064534.1 hypothetical protein [Limibacillus halophilus]